MVLPMRRIFSKQRLQFVFGNGLRNFSSDGKTQPPAPGDQLPPPSTSASSSSSSSSPSALESVQIKIVGPIHADPWETLMSRGAFEKLFKNLSVLRFGEEFVGSFDRLKQLQAANPGCVFIMTQPDFERVGIPQYVSFQKKESSKREDQLTQAIVSSLEKSAPAFAVFQEDRCVKFNQDCVYLIDEFNEKQQEKRRLGHDPKSKRIGLELEFDGVISLRSADKTTVKKVIILESKHEGKPSDVTHLKEKVNCITYVVKNGGRLPLLWHMAVQVPIELHLGTASGKPSDALRKTAQQHQCRLWVEEQHGYIPFQ